jgi:hypothetical protein
VIINSVGHVPRDPGYRVPTLAHTEYHYNRIVAVAAAHLWWEQKFRGGAMLDVPWAPNSNASILERDRLARAFGKVDFLVEIHHNYDPTVHDYACCFYHAGNDVSRALAAHLQRALLPIVKSWGVERWFVWDLPDERFGHKAAVEDASYPAVIIEPAFMNWHYQYFSVTSIVTFGRALGAAELRFYKDHFGV